MTSVDQRDVNYGRSIFKHVEKIVRQTLENKATLYSNLFR